MEAYVTTLGVRLLALPYHLDIEYTYYVPETLDGEHTVGEFVLVPFGAANKRHTALVTSVSHTDDYQKLKPILSVINESLTLDAEMMALASFLCDRRKHETRSRLHVLYSAHSQGSPLPRTEELGRMSG